MSHRRAGVKGIQQQRKQKDSFQKVGQAVKEQQIDQIKADLSEFKIIMERFAKEHAAEIRKDPIYRSQFQKMCNQVGVDPLASNKSYWSKLLGFGDFYFEVSVQIAQICISTRDQNGGLIELDQLKVELAKLRGSKSDPISEDDIVQSIKCLKPLGEGFCVLKIAGNTYIRSVPEELSQDLTEIISACEPSPVTRKFLMETLKWDQDRVLHGITQLLQQSILWIDEQGSELTYWVAGNHI